MMERPRRKLRRKQKSNEEEVKDLKTESLKLLT